MNMVRLVVERRYYIAVGVFLSHIYIKKLPHYSVR